MRFFTKALDRTHISYKCTWARSREQAVSQLAYLRPDITFLNVDTVGIKALAGLERIRATPPLEGVPVIIHTAAITQEYKNEAALMGVYCLERPDTVSDLGDALGKLVGAEQETANNINV
jgi:CheY-like chemotaxis protein